MSIVCRYCKKEINIDAVYCRKCDKYFHTNLTCCTHKVYNEHNELVVCSEVLIKINIRKRINTPSVAMDVSNSHFDQIMTTISECSSQVRSLNLILVILLTRLQR